MVCRSLLLDRIQARRKQRQNNQSSGNAGNRDNRQYQTGVAK